MKLFAKIVADLKKFQRLRQRLVKNLYKRAVRAGAKLCVADLRNRVPVATGALKKSIASKVDTPTGETTAFAVIGPRSSFTKTINGKVKKPSRYFHFVDNSDSILGPTFASGQSKYLDAIQQVLQRGIEEGMR